MANAGIQRKGQNKGRRAPHSYYIANGGWPYGREIRLGAEFALDRQIAALGIPNELEQRIPLLQAFIGATSRIQKRGFPVISAPSRKLAEVPDVGQLLKASWLIALHLSGPLHPP